MELNDYKTNPEQETKGKWFEYEDARFLIAANQNPVHRRALMKLGKRLQRALRREEPEAQETLLIEGMADGVLLGWENLTAGGQPYMFNRENAVKLLRQSRVLREFVAEQSMNLQNFVDEGEAAAQADTKSGAPVAPPVG